MGFWFVSPESGESNYVKMEKSLFIKDEKKRYVVMTGSSHKTSLIAGWAQFPKSQGTSLRTTYWRWTISELKGFFFFFFKYILWPQLIIILPFFYTEECILSLFKFSGFFSSSFQCSSMIQDRGRGLFTVLLKGRKWMRECAVKYAAWEANRGTGSLWQSRKGLVVATQKGRDEVRVRWEWHRRCSGRPVWAPDPPASSIGPLAPCLSSFP